ncbi:hypothetical protein R3P38DRAFT_2793742 [Favolaschia claudopus]|uniref:Uncharacterized protein n=1 Tax=Favolaschia claudopus TaxID=2862362 RepID=A0AAW0ABW2_9AGAR
MSSPYYSLASPTLVPPVDYCSLLSLGNAQGRISHLAHVDFALTPEGEMYLSVSSHDTTSPAPTPTRDPTCKSASPSATGLARAPLLRCRRISASEWLDLLCPALDIHLHFHQPRNPHRRPTRATHLHLLSPHPRPPLHLHSTPITPPPSPPDHSPLAEGMRSHAITDVFVHSIHITAPTDEGPPSSAKTAVTAERSTAFSAPQGRVQASGEGGGVEWIGCGIVNANAWADASELELLAIDALDLVFGVDADANAQGPTVDVEVDALELAEPSPELQISVKMSVVGNSDCRGMQI